MGDDKFPSLKELAANTEAAIEHINENRTSVHSTQLVDYCRVNYELAEELASLVRDFIDYGGTKAKLAELEQKLGSR
jgi:wobble nucleotide-excising tRNase